MNNTDIAKYPDLLEKLMTVIQSKDFENSFADHFWKAYEFEVDKVFDQRFFTNETFYSNPIYHDFNFFGKHITTKNEWWFFLDETDGI